MIDSMLVVMWRRSISGLPEAVRIDAGVLALVRRHALECYPSEAIGVLGGDGRRIAAALRLTNRARRPGATAVWRADLAAAQADLAVRGLRRVGAFHSHPGVPAVPSPLDLRAMRPGAIELIVSVSAVRSCDVRMWRMADDGTPVELAWLG